MREGIVALRIAVLDRTIIVGQGAVCGACKAIRRSGRVDSGGWPGGVRRAIGVYLEMGWAHTRCAGCDNAASGECRRTCGGRDGGPAVIHRSELCAAGGGEVLMLHLRRSRGEVLLMIGGQFGGRGIGVDSARSTVEAGVVNVGGAVDHG